MRRIQIVFQAFGLLVMLPVFIVFVLEIAFSPLQPVARAGESHPVFEVNDIMLEDAGPAADASVDAAEYVG